MKFFTSFILITFTSLIAVGQYTTPDTGVNWTLNDIATNSPSSLSVTGNVYTLLEDLTIAPNDTLVINSDLTLEIEMDVRVTVFGSFSITANNVLITAVDPTSPYDGFRFEEFSNINIQNATIEYGGGLRVLTEDFILNNSVIQYQVEGVATGGAVSLSRGAPEITNNDFLFNDTPAIASGANQSVSPYIFNNHIEGNNQANDNKPQINLGGTTTDTLKIIQNSIIGDPSLSEAGGIAIANFFGNDVFAVIEGNIIQDNRYGLTINGATNYVLIKDNIIEDNNTQGLPNLGGSGINLIAASNMNKVIVMGNEIRRNLWGVTLQNNAQANFGDDQDNPGGNVFFNNGNNGATYALFNNTPNTLMAKHNCWVEGGSGTLAEAEAVISHMVDDPNLGEVIFDPVNCQLSSADFSSTDISLYPNPSTGILNIESQFEFDRVEFYNMKGQQVFSQKLEHQHILNFNLSAGIYFVKLISQDSSYIQKLIVK